VVRERRTNLPVRPGIANRITLPKLDENPGSIPVSWRCGETPAIFPADGEGDRPVSPVYR